MFATVCILGGLCLAALLAVIHGTCVSMPPKARLLCYVWKMVEEGRTTGRRHELIRK